VKIRVLDDLASLLQEPEEVSDRACSELDLEQQLCRGATRRVTEAGVVDVKPDLLVRRPRRTYPLRIRTDASVNVRSRRCPWAQTPCGTPKAGIDARR
jgi:hypothetical protein